MEEGVDSTTNLLVLLWRNKGIASISQEVGINVYLKDEVAEKLSVIFMWEITFGKYKK